MQSLAVPFYMNEITNSNFWVGSSAFAVLIPSLFMTPVAGIWSDRISRKTILFGSFFTQLACSVAFLTLYAADLLTPWVILGLQVVVGVASGFQWAPTQAMTAQLVPPEDLLSAVRFVSLSFTAGRAPSAGGRAISRPGDVGVADVSVVRAPDRVVDRRFLG